MRLSLGGILWLSARSNCISMDISDLREPASFSPSLPQRSPGAWGLGKIQKRSPLFHCFRPCRGSWYSIFSPWCSRRGLQLLSLPSFFSTAEGQVPSYRICLPWPRRGRRPKGWESSGPEAAWSPRPGRLTCAQWSSPHRDVTVTLHALLQAPPRHARARALPALLGKVIKKNNMKTSRAP